MTLKPCPFCDGEALGIDHPAHKHHFVKMPDHPGSYTIECVKCSVGLIAPTQAEAEAAWNQRTSGVTDGMVNRFLSWRLPKDFAPDCGIKFTVINHPDALTHLWPVGTNLLTAIQTRQMLEHVVAVPPEVGALDPKGIERLQRIRDYAYQLQNRLDNRPARFNMDYTRARLSALCWAIERISGQPFDAQGGTSAPSPLAPQFYCKADLNRCAKQCGMCKHDERYPMNHGGQS